MKPVLRDHCHERPPVLKDHNPGRRSYISMQLNLSPKSTCLERPYFYGQWGGLSRQVLMYILDLQCILACICESILMRWPAFCSATIIMDNYTADSLQHVQAEGVISRSRKYKSRTSFCRKSSVPSSRSSKWGPFVPLVFPPDPIKERNTYHIKIIDDGW